MSEKMKVKDLATELNIQPKDLLAAAKEMGLQAKTSAASLTESEVSRLKTRFTPQEKRDNVIVRRRVKADTVENAPETVALETVAPEATAQKAATPAEVENTAPVKAKIVPAVAPEATEKTDDAPEQAKSAPADKTVAPADNAAAALSSARKQPEAASSSRARVIHMPETPKPQAPPSAQKLEESAPVEAEHPKQEAPKPEAPRAPAMMPNLSAEPERNADGQAVSSAPILAPRQEREDRPADRPLDLFGDSDDGDDNAQHHNKKKRHDDSAPVSQVKVISRPHPNAPKPAAEGAPRPQGGYQGQGAPRPAGGYQGQGAPRPAGGYQGQGAPRPAGGYQGQGAPRPAGGYQGQGAPRPAGGYQGQGAPRPAGGYQGQGAPRPAGGYQGQGGRPGAPFPPRDDNRPPRTDGQRPDAPRPPRPGGFTPAPLDSAPGADSRKKRDKGRRTVDFTAGKDAGRRFKDSENEGVWNKGQRKGKGRKGREMPAVSTQPIKAAKRKIRVDEFIRVSDLAHQMGLKTSEIIKVLFSLGVMATINQTLDVDTATLVSAEFDYEVEKVGFSEQDILEAGAEDKPEDLVIRPPVVTIMGHVDHGKTSLLDAIRKSSVATGEAGGITQHIGAYHVKTKKGEIVFLDTPGHAAFTAMRARGAEVTDIVVLVVAADDGVMEQTKEAISHAKAAGVPIMVAVNKIDKPEANLDRVKRELADQGLVAEDWGGDTVFSHVSAKTREGLDDLLELLALQAEILELKANPNKSARGHIVEAKLDKGRGALGTILIQQGTLKVGDPFVCGIRSGRVRAMFDDQGRKVKTAGPSMPVEVQGFEGVPEAGDEFVSLPDEKTARRIADSRAIKQREKDLARESKITLETFLLRRADSVEALNLNLIIKADVQGSLEAIQDALAKLSTPKVRINVLHGGAGAISESDVLLAATSEAIIIGFNVRPNGKTKELAEQEKVDIRFYDIIYKLVEEVTSAMEGMLAPVEKEVYMGTAEVREIFTVPKVGTVAGCHVSDGKFVRNAQVRLLRDSVVVHTGKLSSLRRFKDDVKEVLKGYECGMGLENYNDLKVGDTLEAFEIVEEAATL